MAKYDFIVGLGTETKTLLYFFFRLKRKRTQGETIFKLVYIGNATLQFASTHESHIDTTVALPSF